VFAADSGDLPPLATAQEDLGGYQPERVREIGFGKRHLTAGDDFWPLPEQASAADLLSCAQNLWTAGPVIVAENACFLKHSGDCPRRQL